MMKHEFSHGHGSWVTLWGIAGPKAWQRPHFSGAATWEVTDSTAAGRNLSSAKLLRRCMAEVTRSAPARLAVISAVRICTSQFLSGTVRMEHWRA